MKQTIHLYTICWNETKFLNFFFQYYDSIVDEYHFYDDGSDDSTLSMLEAHPKVNIHSFETIEDSYVLSAQRLHESHWKNSKGKANWVIVTAVDEFLYHPDILDYLKQCTLDGITAIPAIGFQMISDFYPKNGMPLINQVTSGAYFTKMNKLSIFNPDAMTTTNYAPGRHKADPQGNICYPTSDVLLNLHYKYLSLEETFIRHKELDNKLRGFDKEKNFGHRYRWDLVELKKDWQLFMDKAIPNVFSKKELQYLLEVTKVGKWWRP